MMWEGKELLALRFFWFNDPANRGVVETVWKTLRADQLCSEVVHLASKAFIGNKCVLYA